MKICSFYECGEPSKIKGLCQGHNSHRLAGKTLKPLRKVAARGIDGKPFKKECLFEGCNRRQYTKKYCIGHAKQIRNGQKLRPLRTKDMEIASDRPCSFDGCDWPQLAKGYCTTHYNQHNKGLPLKPRRKFYSNKGICIYEGCENVRYARSYCAGHYSHIMSGEEPHDLKKRHTNTFCLENNCGELTVLNGLCRRHNDQRRYQEGKRKNPPKEKKPIETCRVADCTKRKLDRGLCFLHLCLENGREPRRPVLQEVPRPHTPEELKAFFSIKYYVDENGCWISDCPQSQHGYGKLFYEGYIYGAYRLALEISLGRPLKPGMFACHTCPNKSCINPAHLIEGPAQLNSDHMAIAGVSRKKSGESNPQTKFSNAIISRIRRWRVLHPYMKTPEIARRVGNGVLYTYVQNVVRKVPQTNFYVCRSDALPFYESDLDMMRG